MKSHSNWSGKLNNLNVRYVQCEVNKLNLNHQRVNIAGDDSNGDITDDYLVIAMGRRLATEKMGGFFECSHHSLGVKGALKFGAAVKIFTEG